MTDTVYIQGGQASEIFAGKSLKEVAERRHPDLVKAMVEVESGTVAIGDVWTGRGFEKPAPPPDEPKPRDPLAELDALKAELRTKGVIDAAISAVKR